MVLTPTPDRHASQFWVVYLNTLSRGTPALGVIEFQLVPMLGRCPSSFVGGWCSKHTAVGGKTQQQVCRNATQ